MSDLTEFLLARIAEDEAVARGAEDVGRWSVRSYLPSGVEGEVYVVSDDGPNDAYGAVCGSESEGYHSTVEPGNAAHIARHHPARVLAECEAKRRIVEQVSDVEWAGYAVRDFILENLAAVYSDHPDFDEAWRA